MLATKICGAAALVPSAASAAATLALKVVVGVVSATVRVQASFAPISMVTYCPPCRTACCACVVSAAEREPETASL